MPDRRTFDTIEAALEAFNLPSDNLAAVRDHLSEREYEQRCYIVSSGQYIGLKEAGSLKTVYINRGFIDYRDGENDWTRILLPSNKIRDGGYTQGKGYQREAQACPNCGSRMPLSGVCDLC
ncbi:hypothetical protein GCM10009846_26270 [Agrococcus versicolor]|uniref:Uncharacterized protein n=2 Tax=Agrococcus versicolor TaxID=501482 RepID=A0ABP5MLX1_9MICO